MFVSMGRRVGTADLAIGFLRITPNCRFAPNRIVLAEDTKRISPRPSPVKLFNAFWRMDGV